MTVTSVLEQTSLDRLDTELLLAYTLKVDRSYIKAHPERRLSLAERLRFLYYAWLRRRNTPIAYITGHKAFFGLDFVVNKHTLVPRPETEQMVSLALDRVEELRLKTDNLLLIDIGSGSGCIPISILKKCTHTSIQTYASDISKKALQVAKRNAKTHEANIRFVHGNLLEPILRYVPRNTWLASHIIITANLPYITEEQWKEESSIKKEPKSALVADEQGLALYRELLEQMQKLNIQSSTSLYFEIDPDQTTRIEPLVREYFRDAHVILHEDLSGHTRIALINIV